MRNSQKRTVLTRLKKWQRHYKLSVISYKNVLFNLKFIKQAHPDNPWLDWYEGMLRGLLPYAKLYRFIPPFQFIKRILKEGAFYGKMFNSLLLISSSEDKTPVNSNEMVLIGNVALPPPPRLW